MTKRKLLWAGVCALFFISIACLWGLYGTHSVSLTEAQVQERVTAQLDKEFSVGGKAGLLVRNVRVKNAAVHIADGKLAALVDVEGTLRVGQKFSLTSYAVGAPTYHDGRFFFKPSTIEVRKFVLEDTVKSRALARLVERYLPDEKARQDIADWVTETAQSAATHALEQRPIYTLKNDVRGVLIKASLESVKIERDSILITFSLMQLTLSVALGIFCVFAAVGLAWALLEFPALGAAIIVSS